MISVVTGNVMEVLSDSYMPFFDVEGTVSHNFMDTSYNKTLKALLGGKPGLVVIMAAGGDYTPAGKFATPVQLAMMTDGEKFLGGVPEFEISGNLFELFGEDFIGCSSDKPFYGMHTLTFNMKIN